jgi:hypothetical protein
MTPSELATMPGDRCILQLRGLPPFYSKKYDLKQHPNYRFTAEADKVKNAFDLDRLIDRRRRPGLNEECEVYEVSVPDEALTDEDEDILNYDDLDDPDAFVWRTIVLLISIGRAQKMQSQKPQKSTENTATPSPIIFFQMQRTRMKV